MSKFWQMSKLRHSFNKMNILLIACISALTVIICAFVYYYARDIILREKENMYISSIKQLNSNINAKLGEAVTINRLFTENIKRSNLLDKIIETQNDLYALNKLSMDINKDVMYIDTFSEGKFSFILLSKVSFEFKNNARNVLSKTSGSIDKLSVYSGYKKASNSGKTYFVTSKSEKEEITNFLISENTSNHETLRRNMYIALENHILSVIVDKTQTGNMFISIIVINLSNMAELENSFYLNDLYAINNNNEIFFRKTAFGMNTNVTGIPLQNQNPDDKKSFFTVNYASQNYKVFYDNNDNAGFTLFHPVAENTFTKEAEDLKSNLIILLIPSLLFVVITTYLFCRINVFLPIKNMLSRINSRSLTNLSLWKTNHRLNNIPLNSKYILVFLIVFIITNLFLIWNCYYKTCDILEKSKQDYLKAMSDYTTLNIESLMNNYENLAKHIMLQDGVQYLLCHNAVSDSYTGNTNNNNNNNNNNNSSSNSSNSNSSSSSNNNNNNNNSNNNNTNNANNNNNNNANNVNNTNNNTNNNFNNNTAVTSAVLNHPFNMNGINNIKIFNKKGNLAYSLINNASGTYNEKLYFLIPELDNNSLRVKPFWQFYQKEDGNVTISFTKEIVGYGSQAIVNGVSLEYKKVGYISVEISEMVINKVYSNIDTRYQNVMLLDNSDSIVSCSLGSNDKDIYNDFMKNIQYEAKPESISSVVKEIGNNGWKVVLLINIKNIQNDVNAIILSGFVFLLIIVVLISLVIIALINSLVIPVYELNSALSNVRDRDGSLTYIDREHFVYDEITQLGNSFNAMIGRINYLIGTVYTSKINQSLIEKKKNEAELNALQSQINPHFIYNTLESIKWMIKLKKNSDALTMVELFGRLLKISINRGKTIVPVQEELEHVEAYIEIQKIRYSERLNFEVFIEEGLSEYGIVKLILQPLIENSMVHGFKNKKSTLCVKLTMKKLDDLLVINLTDNGCGIEPEKLEEINIKLYSETIESIGLKNVHDRLKMYFGEKSVFKIESTYGQGTSIEIIIPAVKGIGGNNV